MNDVFQYIGLKVDWNFTWVFSGLIMTRLAMVTSTIPFLVGKPVPGTIRIGFTLVMLLFLYPHLAPADHSLLPSSPLMIVVLFLKEAFYGIAIGLASSIVFHGFEAAGSMVDNQRGAAQARLLIPQLGEQSSLFGNLTYQLGIVIFMSLGGHLIFMKAVIESYDLLPILSLPQARPDFIAMSEEFIKMSGMVLLLALQLTAPVLISIFIADVILGIMTKTAPSINVFELSFGVKGVLGVVIYFLALGIMITQIEKLSYGVGEHIQRILRLLALSPNFTI